MNENTDEMTQKLIREMFLRAVQEDSKMRDVWGKGGVITLPAGHPRMAYSDPEKCFTMFRTLSENKPPYEVDVCEDRSGCSISRRTR